MNRRSFTRWSWGGAIAGLGALAFTMAAHAWDGNFVQSGRMREVIGERQDRGRVRLGTLLARPHFYGVAALARLDGEVTIQDGRATVTRVDVSSGQLVAGGAAVEELEAALLFGSYVSAWNDVIAPHSIEPGGFDSFVGGAASRAGLDTSKPVVFTVEGEVTQVRLHVIHGACPLHARLKKLVLPPDQKPFEGELAHVRATLVGIHARDAVGNITHPATSTHVHILYTDPLTGSRVTGHVEQVGLAKGAILRLPR